MGKQNHGKPWTPKAIKEVKTLAKQNTPTPLIAWKTGRTEDAIRSLASTKRISLKPTNKSPYG
jgi:hypothetical protein